MLIELTPAQLTTLQRWLDEQATIYMQRDQAQRDQAAHLTPHHADRLRQLATLTALVHGLLPGMAPEAQASAAWNSFIAYEGVFTPMDVDPSWEITTRHADVWEQAYAETLEAMRAGDPASMTQAQARRDRDREARP